MKTLLRPRDGGHEAGRVTYVELFFDLVFVFAITQLSHTLLEDLSLVGWLKITVLLVGIWWMWIDTAWITNWLDPRRRRIRVMLLVLMLLGLVLSTSLPEAFERQAVLFGLTYGAIHVTRSGLALWALREAQKPVLRTFQRILSWHLLVAVMWAVGAFAGEALRLPIWAAAILLESAAPSLGYWTPGLGRSLSADWDVEGSHMAERCALFIIIALGESVLVIGATVSSLERTPEVIGAFLTAFMGSVAMWWIYFSNVVELGARRIRHSHDPGHIARLAYTYFHLPIVAGIIVTAVADERVLHHPGGHADGGTTAAVLIGGGLYLAGAALFKFAVSGHVPLARLAGMAAILALWPLADHLTPLALAAASTSVLIAVAVWEGWVIKREAANTPEVD